MKLQHQTTPTNCLSACIASLLEIPIAEVPNFTEAEQGQGNIAMPSAGHPAWWNLLQKWLAEKGFLFIEMKLMAEGQVTVDCPLENHQVSVGLNVHWNPLPTSGLVIFMGKTAAGINHAEVGRVEEDRFIPIFNPKPDSPGITEINSLGFLVPRDPAVLVNMGRKLEAIERLAQSEIMSKHLLETIEQTARDGLGKPPKTSVKLFSANGKRMDQ